MHGWLVFGRKSICPVGVDGTDFLTLDYTSEMLKKQTIFRCGTAGYRPKMHGKLGNYTHITEPSVCTVTSRMTRAGGSPATRTLDGE
jgi:hypothetical protein